MGVENLFPAGIQSLNRPRQSLSYAHYAAMADL